MNCASAKIRNACVGSIEPSFNRFTNVHVKHLKSEKNQIYVSNPNQTVRFTVCICMYVVIWDIIRFVGYRLLCHQN